MTVAAIALFTLAFVLGAIEAVNRYNQARNNKRRSSAREQRTLRS